MDQRETWKNKERAGSTVDLSVVIPAFQEAEGIEEMIEAVSRVATELSCDFELVVVDDGGQDGTFEVVKSMAQKDSRVRGIRLSRNFGKEAAIAAGLRASRGKAVITMDADLQHPPELIPTMMAEWSNGAKVVHAVKRNKQAQGIFARVSGAAFYKAMKVLSGYDLQGSSDYKLLDREVVNALCEKITETARFYRGLTRWVGFQQVAVFFDVEERRHGVPKLSISKLVGLAKDAIIAFTATPLRIVTYLGVLTMFFGFYVGADAVISFFRGEAVSGFATTIITLLFIGSLVMISLGIIGEYIARIYDELKARPIYLIEERCDNGGALGERANPRGCQAKPG